jgi:hypothetical protein
MMKSISTAVVCVALVLMGWVHPVSGQNVTTGTITGLVSDQQGGVLPGATVSAVHEPTGTTYEGVTQGDGRFSLLNVRVGGPYQVVVTLAGFRSETINAVTVVLGESTELPVTLVLQSISEVIQVTAESIPLFSASKAGTSDSVATEVLETLPTINRSIQDFARVSPHFVQYAFNGDPSALSVAGRNTRYNNLQIDGAVNNDLFSIAASAGTPGGSAETQPISLDAIQELQLVVAPYDVRQGSFAGGGVNAITRSGTNSLRGSAFYVFRDQSLVGNGIDDRPIATFNDKQFGGTLGGPIVRSKAFFLGNLEWGRKDTPAGYSVSGTSGVSFGRQAEAQRFLDILQRRYSYNPGTLDEFIRGTQNDKVFARTDFNLGNSQLTVRHNYVDGFNDVGTQNNVTYKLPDNFYRFHSQTNSTVGQLNSSFGSKFNEFRVTYQRIRDFRTTDTRFPQVTVRLPDGGRFVAGTEQFSTANELDQDIFEITNDLTIVRNSHTFTVGTHNEFFKFRNLFIRDNFGTYEFASLDTFEAGSAQLYDYSFSLTGDPQFAAKFAAYQLGFYVGDQWRIRPNFTLTYGVRWDKPFFPDTPTANPQAVATYGYATDVVPETQTWSPRAGFNWDLTNETTRQQVRGGIGVFGGRTPYVWLSNQYGNTGIEFRRLQVSPFAVTNNIPFVPNPDGQPTSVGRATTNEIDVLDPDYDFPQVMRGNLAYDRSLPLGLTGTVEFLFANDVKDIGYSNINLVQAATREDGRPVWSGRVNSTFGDVILLTNSTQGKSWSVAGKVDKQFRGGWFASGSYLYGQAKSINDGTNSQARSTWINVYTAGDINNPPLAISNYDVGHRIILTGSYLFTVRSVGVTLSAFYNGQTGRPYSYNFGSDVNLDGASTNDLLFYPRDGDVAFSTGTYQELATFLEAGNCTDVVPGAIVTRNSCRMPWTNGLDFHAAVNANIGRWKPEFTFDILNLINLFDSSKGQVEYAAFHDLLVANAVASPTGDYTYSVNSIARPGGVRYTRDDLRSRWQAQIGLRLRF